MTELCRTLFKYENKIDMGWDNLLKLYSSLKLDDV